MKVLTKMAVLYHVYEFRLTFRTQVNMSIVFTIKNEIIAVSISLLVTTSIFT